VASSLGIAGTLLISNHSGSFYSSGIIEFANPQSTASFAVSGLSKSKTSLARRRPIYIGKFRVEVPSGDWKDFIKGV